MLFRKLSVKEVFDKKAQKFRKRVAAALGIQPDGMFGNLVENVAFDQQLDCFIQKFENATLCSNRRDVRRTSQVCVVFGKTNEYWKENQHWIGMPIADTTVRKNYVGDNLLVSHFANGVIWSEVKDDGQSFCLSNHDLKVISKM